MRKINWAGVIFLMLLLLFGCVKETDIKEPSAVAPPAEVVTPPREAPAAAVPPGRPASGVIIKLLSPAEKKALENSLDRLEPTRKKISSALLSLEALATKKKDAQLREDVERLSKITTGNTILVLLSEVNEDLETLDESLDEDSLKLKEEIDVAYAIVTKILLHVKQLNDRELIIFVTVLQSHFKEMAETYEQEYVRGLEKYLKVDFDDIDGDGRDNEDDADDDNDGVDDEQDEDDDNDGVTDDDDFVDEEYEEELEKEYGISDPGEEDEEDDEDDENDEDETNETAPGEALPGYPTSPMGNAFEKSFDEDISEDDVFEVLDGYKYWTSWYAGDKTSVQEGILIMKTNTEEKEGDLLRTGGVASKAYYSYGTLTFRAKANPMTGTVSGIYFYNEDKDMNEGGTHEEIDVELSSKYPERASIITFHNDNWQNDEKQNEMHRGEIKNIQAIEGLEDFSSHEWNTYVIDWQPGKITWSINTIKVEELTEAVPTTPMQIRLDTYNNKEWDAFIEPEPEGDGALEVDFIRYVPTSDGE